VSDRHKDTAKAGIKAKPDESGSLALPSAQPKLWKQDFVRWVPAFMASVKSAPTARHAWGSIQRHCMGRVGCPSSGLVGQAALLLFLSTPRFVRQALSLPEHYQLAQEYQRLFKRARLAEVVAGRGRPRQSRRGRPRLNPEKAVIEAVCAPWFVGDSNIATVQEAFERLERETGRTFTVAEAGRLLVRTAGLKQSPFNEMYLLAVLQEVALEYGLKLGHKQITALAECAGVWPDWELKEAKNHSRTLARYFRAITGKDRRTIREGNLPSLRPLAIRREEFPRLFDSL
jgi:hypothetical protein